MRIVRPLAILVALLVSTIRTAPAQVLQPHNLSVAKESKTADAGDDRFDDVTAVTAAWSEEVPHDPWDGEAIDEAAAADLPAPLCGDLLCGDEVGPEGFDVPHAGGQWSALTELTTLFPSYSTTTLATANEHPILGPRVSVGWESDRGFGIRGHGWGFDGDSKIEQSPTPSTQGLLPYYDYYYGYYYSNSPAQVVSHQINFSGSRFDLDFYKRVKHSGEAALGLEYRRPFRYADLSVQCAFEVQSWDVSIAERINLAGVTTGVGLSW